MLVKTYDHLDAAELDSGWDLYCRAFDELRIRAVQRHLMTRAEFEEVMRDRRVTKYAAVEPDQGDRLCGLATMSNQLDAFPLISPDYFAHRWPERYQQRRIWYVGFLAAHPDCKAQGVFPLLVAEMARVVAAAGGIVAMDVSRRVDEVYGLPRIAARFIGSLVEGVRHERLDEQSYWAYEFPAAS